MNIIKFIRISSGRKEYYSDFGPVQNIYQAKKFSDKEVEGKINFLKNSEFANTCIIQQKNFSDELNDIQSAFQKSIEDARAIFEIHKQ